MLLLVTNALYLICLAVREGIYVGFGIFERYYSVWRGLSMFRHMLVRSANASVSLDIFVQLQVIYICHDILDSVFLEVSSRGYAALFIGHLQSFWVHMSTCERGYFAPKFVMARHVRYDSVHLLGRYSKSFAFALSALYLLSGWQTREGCNLNWALTIDMNPWMSITSSLDQLNSVTYSVQITPSQAGKIYLDLLSQTGNDIHGYPSLVLGLWPPV